MAERGSLGCIFPLSRRGSWWQSGHSHLVFACSVMLVMVLFLPCDEKDQIDGIRSDLLYDSCENFGDFDCLVGTRVGLPGSFDIKSVYSPSASFHFPSTLIGLCTNFDGLRSEKKSIDVDNVGSCKRLSLLNSNPMTFSFESSSASFVEISPPLLEWGTNGLFTLSLLHLTVGNTHSSRMLHFVEPFSSDGQFYANGFEKFSLDPGDVGSISVVFLPRRLDLVWAHVVLQMSFGGFVIHANRITIESPYGVEQFHGFELLSDGRLSWNLALYNTVDDVLYVEEIGARILISLESASHSNQVICNIGASQNSRGNFGSFCKSGDREFPWMEIRPHKHWEVTPLDTEIILKMDLPPVQDHISGVICIKLQKLTQDKFIAILVPLEAEVDSKPTYNSLTGSISVLFESLVPRNGMSLICILSIRNSAPCLLRVVSITDNLKVFEVKYVEGLLLYPDTITQLALIIYNHPDVSEHMAAKFPWMSPNCKLTLSTNDSVSPLIMIPCQDMVKTFCGIGVGSDFVEPESLLAWLKSQEQKLINARTGSLGCIVEESHPLKLKFLELLEAVRLIFGSWRSQSTINKLSVLNEQELTFKKIEFTLDLPTIFNSSSPDSSFQLETGRKLCVPQLNKDLYAKKVGELPLRVKKLEASVTGCGSDGFMTQPCKGFSLALVESERLLISYRTEFYGSLVRRNLRLVLDSGFLVIPMEASLSLDLMDLCNNSSFPTVIRKFSALIFTAVLIFCLLFILLHPNASGSKVFSVKNTNTIAIIRNEKSSRIHRNARVSRSIKKKENLKEGVVLDTYPCSGHSVQENTRRMTEKNDSDDQKKLILLSSPPSRVLVGGLDSSETPELPQNGNLTGNVVKERGRRRKRRAGGGGITSKFEVSSSQSGSSTPSSPLSPDSFTPNSSFSSHGAVSEEHNHEKKQEFSFPVEPSAPEPQREIARPILLPPTSFPITGCRTPGVTSNLLASSSPIAPYAHAPGSKLSKEKGTEIDVDEAIGKNYTYDIWGNHFCGDLMGKPKELPWKVLDASEGDSQSFFTRDPQSLMMVSSALCASGHKLTPPNVDYLYEIK